ncbi:MAG TPA: hypothetical protein VMT42_00010 [candidate division Zixibacteria bacterium]|nr:hypothetical protein [candidate division Zixibacteria bacterium]
MSTVIAAATMNLMKRLSRSRVKICNLSRGTIFLKHVGVACVDFTFNHSHYPESSEKVRVSEKALGRAANLYY